MGLDSHGESDQPVGVQGFRLNSKPEVVPGTPEPGSLKLQSQTLRS